MAARFVLGLAFLCRAGTPLLAPFDADQECLASSRNSSGTVPLLDSHHYLSLESLWFADDESIDLFLFPVPEDPVRWQLIDQSDCRNVWQYCGGSSTDILISQFITGVQSSTSISQFVIAVEFSLFSSDLSLMDLCSRGTDSNVLIVEVDDTTGQDNVHTELISLCMGNQPSLRHDFMYTPMSQHFELVFRSNLTTEACVNISRVRVFHCDGSYLPIRDDTGATSSMITCTRCPIGHYLDTETGQCFLCPNFSTGSRDQCVCDIGHQRSIPGDYSLPCDECTSGYFASDNGSCTGCPLPGFDNIGSTDSACKCFNETNLTCQFCAANYVRNLSLADCILCPAGSRRELMFTDSGEPSLELEGFCTYTEGSLTPDGQNTTSYEPSLELEGFCTCTEGSSTPDGQNTTSYERCDSCSNPLVWNGTQCVPCPANSQLATPDAVRCTCDPNALTLAGQNETVTQPCFCMDGFYRPPGLRECQVCPRNSFRALSDLEDSCPCLEGYTRESGTESLVCFVYIGFNTSSLVLMEGEGQQVNNVTVILSRTSAASVPVNFSVTTMRELNVQVRPRFATLANVQTLDLVLTHVGNTVALEEDASLSLSLLVSETGDVIVGGPGLFGQLNIVISDDDLLHVGFTKESLVYVASEQKASIRVNISTPIGRQVVLLIRSNDTLSPNFQPSVSRELIFSPNEPTSALFEFDVMLARAHVLISLEVATYPESLNSVRERITVGRYPGLYREAVLVVGVEPGRSLSRSAVVGIAFSAALIPVVCLSVITILCGVYICYRQQATKSGAKGDTPILNGKEVEMTKLTTEEL